MKFTSKTKLVALALAPAALLAFTGCTHTEPSPFANTNPSANTKAGVPGGFVVDTQEVTAKVTAIDREHRMVTLQADNGNATTFKCGPEVRNFAQIHVNDVLTVLLTEQLAVSVADAKSSVPDGTSSVVLLSPKGAKPGGIMAETTQVTVKLTGIDTLRNWASFRFPDGTLRHFAVRADVDMKKHQLGEELVIRTTTAMALWVKCP